MDMALAGGALGAGAADRPVKAGDVLDGTMATYREPIDAPHGR